MKKYLSIASMAIAAAFAAACTFVEPELVNDDITPAEPTQEYKLVTVSAENPQTKTAYAGEKTFSWSDEDQISIYCTDATYPANTGFYTFTTETGGSASATFTGSIPATAEIGSVALYPASTGHSYSDSKYHFQVDGEKNYIASHESADVPMYGVNGGTDNFSFTQMTGAVKFTVNNVPDGVDKVKFTFTAASSKLSGSFDVVGSGPYTWNTAKGASEAERSIVRYCPVTSNTFSVYVPYTEGTIWGDNTLLIQDYTGDVVGSTLYNQTNIGAIPVTRNKVTKLATLACDYRSAFGINWSGVAESTNAGNGITKMQATLDENYIYVKMEVDPTKLDTSREKYADLFRFYAGNSSGSTRDWGSDKSSQISEVWAVYKHNITFKHWDETHLSSNLVQLYNDNYCYEIRIARSLSSYISQTSEDIKFGVIIDAIYDDDDGSGRHDLSPSGHIGVIPAAASPMYVIPQLPTPTAVTGSAAIDKTYHETLTETVNPERGLYRHNEYFFTGGSVNKTTVSCESDKTLVLTIFYLQDFIAADHISASAISNIRTILGNVRSAGKKAIVRFAYNNEHHDKDDNPINPREPESLTYIENHITDLADVFSDFKDIIYVVQAGFLGTYGEWYYTTTTGTPLFPMSINVTDNAVTNYSNRAAVIDKLLAKVPEELQIALRTPAYKCYYLHPSCVDGAGSWDVISSWTPADANHRLSFHNDAFLAGEYDMGTFRTSPTTVDRDMWKSQGAWLAVGGETGFVKAEAVNPTYTALEPALQAIKDYHYSYLNDAQSNNEIVKYWVANDIYPIIRKKLGYRLVLNTAQVTGSGWSNGTTLNFKLKISNMGSASVIYPRPCKLVLIHEGSATVLGDMGFDIRDIAPDDSHTYDLNVSLPQDVMTGDKLAIWMPDNAAGLQSNAAYSIRLSNSDVKWENGYNVFYTF